MDLGLRGRTALVGGASAGLGRASAERLAGEGCRLALWSRGGEALERAAAEIRRTHSVDVITISGDAADPFDLLGQLGLDDKNGADPPEGGTKSLG